MPSSAPETRLGDVIGGRYRVLSVLGRGGMGVLYTAEHQLTQRRVALKLLLPDREDLPELHQRFLLEARTAAAVRHPNVVDVLDMGVHEDGSPFLVMELLDGTSLDRVITVQNKLPPERALAVTLPIVGALATLHDQGIVHRDVKPSNIFLAAGLRGEVEPKLLDFGLARTMSDLRLTRSGMVIGTPLYMSPEQAAGEPISFQTDVWSLGVVLFELLSGELPFTSRESGAIAAQVLAGRVRTLGSVSAHIPAPIGHAVDRALRRDVNVRYRDMREFARALVAAALACGVALPDNPDPVGLPEFRAWKTQATVPSTVAAARLAAPAEPPPADAISAIQAPKPLAKPRKSVAIPVLLVAIVLAVGAAWTWAARKQAPPTSQGTSSGPAHGSAQLSPDPPSTPPAASPPPASTPPVPPDQQPVLAAPPTVAPGLAPAVPPDSAAKDTPQPAPPTKGTSRPGGTKKPRPPRPQPEPPKADQAEAPKKGAFELEEEWK